MPTPFIATYEIENQSLTSRDAILPSSVTSQFVPRIGTSCHTGETNLRTQAFFTVFFFCAFKFSISTDIEKPIAK